MLRHTDKPVQQGGLAAADRTNDYQKQIAVQDQVFEEIQSLRKLGRDEEQIAVLGVGKRIGAES